MLQRCRLCNMHMNCLEIAVGGEQFRFCQKCSKLHPIAAFDGNKRSCRIGLQKHNERQRVLRTWTSIESKYSRPGEASDTGAASPGFDEGEAVSAFSVETIIKQRLRSPGTPLPLLTEPIFADLTFLPLGLPSFLPPELEGKTIDELIIAFGMDENDF